VVEKDLSQNEKGIFKHSEGAERPLVTFALIAYNQEQFIREAVNAALSQDYDPLEIILSDDCSSDRTFEIMEELCSADRLNRSVILRRNHKNFGPAQHVNAVLDQARGDLIVLAAGDDISFPNRTSVLVENWLAAGKPAALCSQAIIIDDKGDVISERFTWYDGTYPEADEPRQISMSKLLKNEGRILLGATEAWSRRVLEVFGPLERNVIHEDNVVSLRAWLLDRIVYVVEPLVQYRSHSSNIHHRVATPVSSFDENIANELRAIQRKKNALVTLTQHGLDLKVAIANKLITEREYNIYDKLLRMQVDDVTSQVCWWDSNVLRRLAYLLKMLIISKREAFFYYAPRVVGLRLFCLARSALIGCRRS